jgi:hypothetical protein
MTSRQSQATGRATIEPRLTTDDPEAERTAVDPVAKGTTPTPHARGIAPAELAERSRRHPRALSAEALARWLVEENYATQQGGLLFPTEHLTALDWVCLLVPVLDP